MSNPEATINQQIKEQLGQAILKALISMNAEGGSPNAAAMNAAIKYLSLAEGGADANPTDMAAALAGLMQHGESDFDTKELPPLGDEPDDATLD